MRNIERQIALAIAELEASEEPTGDPYAVGHRHGYHWALLWVRGLLEEMEEL